MKIQTTVYIDQVEIMKLVKRHIECNGFKVIGEVNLIVRETPIPSGAAGDRIGFDAIVEREE